jgi:hypothetical protein
MTSMPTGDQASDVRVSDAERDDVVSQLSEHFQAGRLTADEFDERAGLAIGAKTRGDLTSLMTDLPGGEQGLTRPAAQPATESGQALQPHRGPSRTATVLVVIAAIAVVTSLFGHGPAGHVPWGLILVALLVFRGFFRGRRRARQ